MQGVVKSWRKLQVWDSVYSADSIEFCPVAPYQHVFLCGTYQLNETQDSDTSKEPAGCDKRKGTLILFSLNQSEESIERIRTVDTPAILDIKWCHRRVQDKIVFAVVNAIGQLIVYELVSPAENTLDLNIRELCSHQLDQGEANEILALSLDWSSRMHTNLTDLDRNSIRNPNLTNVELSSFRDPNIVDVQRSSFRESVVVSDSQGAVHLFHLTNSGLQLKRSWKGHGFEAWIAAFNYSQPSVFYSGGDDCLMKVYDVRQDGPVQTIREHGAGVTSIQYNPFIEHTLATGSYDEHLYTWDDRHFKSPKSKTPLGGGVWRIKHQSDLSILTATMYNGFHHIPADVEDSAKILEYNHHGSIAYGIDSCYAHEKYVVTCSFYNHLINLSVLE
ncbi:diphthine methyltransferase isoform X1 [Diaphorina citri]|uniref:methylated diphthine methylhydrolase n=1 Tax=Diaphorina citri TaxID=121845 RepID=A0A1S4EHZ8_DIACI|nr:diphthine methyltransferase isoform X1 [Diaphorina citri]XP_026683406.1 diphthine methyltransferase isoform X1 [Diaphorina citri]